jgi:hypothetical protein
MLEKFVSVGENGKHCAWERRSSKHRWRDECGQLSGRAVRDITLRRIVSIYTWRQKK